jgi:hypothetical protein
MVIYFGLVIIVEILLEYRIQKLIWFLYIVGVMGVVIQNVIPGGIMKIGVMKKIVIENILKE